MFSCLSAVLNDMCSLLPFAPILALFVFRGVGGGAGSLDPTQGVDMFDIKRLPYKFVDFFARNPDSTQGSRLQSPVPGGGSSHRLCPTWNLKGSSYL